MKPIADRILIKEDPKQDKIGSIFLPEEKRLYTGTVQAIGNNVERIKPGHKVWYGRHDPTTINHLGKDMMLVKEKYIYGYAN